MKPIRTLTTWTAALALAPRVTASAPPSVSPSGLAVRNAPGVSAHDTVLRVARALHLLGRREERTVFSNSTSIAWSYDDAVLLKIAGEVGYERKSGNGTVAAGINVVCTRCYMTANATASLTIANTTDEWSAALGNFSSAVADEFHNLTDVAIDWIQETTDSAWQALAAVFDFNDATDPSAVDFPTLDTDFNIDLPTDLLPETSLRVQLDGLEVYLEMDVTVAAGTTYKIPLLPPQISPMGLAQSSDLFIGTVLALELILSAEGDVELSGGVHIALDSGVALELAMFGRNLTNTEFNGGKVEFLPVTVRAGVTLSAILQVSVHTGFSLEMPNVPGFLSSFFPSAGIEASMFANLAEFTTTITAETEDSDAGKDGGDNCLLGAQQDFRVAVGAAAGATLALAGETWGPDPETTIEIWATRIADLCAVSVPATTTATGTTTAAAAITTSSSLAKRQDTSQDLSTATKKTTLRYAGVVCISSLAQCPASLQKHTIATSVATFTSLLPSGATPVWPETAFGGVRSKLAFGTQAKSLFVASGTPTPSMGRSADDNDSIGDKARDLVNGVDKRVVIGVSVGVGGLALVVLGVGVVWWVRRRKADKSQMLGAATEPMIGKRGGGQVSGDSAYYGAEYGAGGYGGSVLSPEMGSSSPETGSARKMPQVVYHAR